MEESPGRRKIAIELIQDRSRRAATFSKRKTGLMKKTFELTTLTGCNALLLVASETGHVYTYATPKLQPLIVEPEGKALIQSCLNAPSPALPSSGQPGSTEKPPQMTPKSLQEPDGDESSDQSDSESPLDHAPAREGFPVDPLTQTLASASISPSQPQSLPIPAFPMMQPLSGTQPGGFGFAPVSSSQSSFYPSPTSTNGPNSLNPPFPQMIPPIRSQGTFAPTASTAASQKQQIVDEISFSLQMSIQGISSAEDPMARLLSLQQTVTSYMMRLHAAETVTSPETMSSLGPSPTHTQ